MKKTATLIAISAFLISASSASASSSVNVHSEANYSNNTQVTSNSETKIDINQTGEGTSRVEVNGKEYKVEGPGSLSVHNDVVTKSSPNPTNSPTPTPSPTGIASPTASASASASPSPIGDSQQGIVEEIISMLQGLISKLNDLF